MPTSRGRIGAGPVPDKTHDPSAPIRAILHQFKRGAGLKDVDLIDLMARGGRPISKSRLGNMSRKPSGRGLPISADELLVLVTAWADEQVRMDEEEAEQSARHLGRP